MLRAESAIVLASCELACRLGRGHSDSILEVVFTGLILILHRERIIGASLCALASTQMFYRLASGSSSHLIVCDIRLYLSLFDLSYSLTEIESTDCFLMISSTG